MEGKRRYQIFSHILPLILHPKIKQFFSVFKTIRAKKMTSDCSAAPSLPKSLYFPNAYSVSFLLSPPSLSSLTFPRSRLRSFNINHWLHSQFTPEIARR